MGKRRWGSLPTLWATILRLATSLCQRRGGRRLAVRQPPWRTAIRRPGAGHTPRSTARAPSNTSQLWAP